MAYDAPKVTKMELGAPPKEMSQAAMLSTAGRNTYKAPAGAMHAAEPLGDICPGCCGEHGT